MNNLKEIDMRADFSQFLGPLPTDVPQYDDPQGSRPLKPLTDTDMSTVSTIRHKLAIREAQMRAAEREESDK